jgi:tRNA G18 (ribose-2'-O)-methylase SpoU
LTPAGPAPEDVCDPRVSSEISPRKLRMLVRKRKQIARRRFRRQRQRNRLATGGVHDFIVVLDHLKPTFNIGKIFRSADAFGALEVHLVGIDFFDPGPALGSFKWVPARFHDRFETSHRQLVDRGYTVFVLEPENGRDLARTRFPRRSAFVFGHEEFGIRFDKQAFGGLRSLKIPQYGKVQSLNVSIAASVVMYEYVRQQAGAAVAAAPD